MRSRFCFGVLAGTYTRPWMPIERHAIAKPCAWLPADEHTTPAAISSVGQLHQQVVRAAQLVRPDRLQVLALEVDRRAGDLRQPLAVLQRGAGDHAGNSLSGLVDVCRGAAAADGCEDSGSVQRTPINSAI